MKKVGIVFDNYKQQKFEAELTKAGFTNYDLSPFTTNTTTLRVDVEDHQVNEVKKICQNVELYFKRSN